MSKAWNKEALRLASQLKEANRILVPRWPVSTPRERSWDHQKHYSRESRPCPKYPSRESRVYCLRWHVPLRMIGILLRFVQRIRSRIRNSLTSAVYSAEI